MRAHHPLQIEAEPIRRRRFEAVDRLALARHDARTVDAQPLGFADQAEFHRVPVEPREIFQCVALQRFQTALPVSMQIIGKDRIEQQWHMAEKIMKHIGLDDVVEFFRLTQPDRHRKAAVRQMLEEGVIRDQSRHCDQLPTGRLHQCVGSLVETWHAFRCIHFCKALDKHIAGPPRQQLCLARVQLAP